jgi:ferredoxin-NADP reductase
MHARSQSWFWLVVPLFLYTCDFLYGLFTVQKTAVCGGKLVDAPKGLLLRISRPATFQFEPGAYVRINVPAISRHEWHPYSIASAPRDRRWIELYVTAIPGGWTDQLYDHLAEHYAEEGTGQICEGLEVKLDGPMGSTFQDTSQQKTLVAVSSGSGAAPFLCLLRALNMTSKLVQSDEKNGNGFRDVGALASVKAAVRQPVQEQPLLPVPSSTMSTFQSVLGPVRSMVTGRTETGRMEGRHDKIAAFYDTLRLDAMYAAATKYCFTYAFFTAGACLDLFLLAISWSLHSNRETADWPYMTVGVLTAWLILLFGVNAVFTRLQRMHTNHSTVKVQDGTLLNNLVLWALMAAVCYCSFREEYKVSTGLLVASSLLRLFRLFWNLANTPLFLQKRNSEAQPVTFLQRVSFLWCTSVDMFRWIGPDLIALAQQLDDSCGTDYFHPYIFIRTASAEQQAEVAAMVAGTPLQGAVQFQISTGHMIVEEICTEVLAGSTLDGTVGIYFCGNGNLAQQLKKSVIVARHKYNVKNRPLVYGAENIY